MEWSLQKMLQVGRGGGVMEDCAVPIRLPPGGGRTLLPALLFAKTRLWLHSQGQGGHCHPSPGRRPDCLNSSSSGDHNILLLKLSASIFLLRNRDVMTILCPYLCLILTFHFSEDKLIDID